MTTEIHETEETIEAAARVDDADPAALPDDAPPAAYRVKSRRRELAEIILPPFIVGACFIGLLNLQL